MARDYPASLCVSARELSVTVAKRERARTMCNCNKGKCVWCGVKFDYFNGHTCEGTKWKAEQEAEANA